MHILAKTTKNENREVLRKIFVWCKIVYSYPFLIPVRFFGKGLKVLKVLNGLNDLKGLSDLKEFREGWFSYTQKREPPKALVFVCGVTPSVQSQPLCRCCRVVPGCGQSPRAGCLSYGTDRRPWA